MPQTELAPGQEPYLRYCASCHGNDGAGKPPTFPPLAGSDWLELGPDAIVLIILNGLQGEIEVSGQRFRGYMPPMRHLSDEQIAQIMTYIGHAWASWEATPDPQRVAALRQAGDAQIFRGRAELERALAPTQ